MFLPQYSKDDYLYNQITAYLKEISELKKEFNQRPFEIARCYYEIFTIYANLRIFGEAEAYLTKIVDYIDKLNHDGMIHFQHGNIAQALLHYNAVHLILISFRPFDTFRIQHTSQLIYEAQRAQLELSAEEQMSTSSVAVIDQPSAVLESAIQQQSLFSKEEEIKIAVSDSLGLIINIIELQEKHSHEQFLIEKFFYHAFIEIPDWLLDTAIDKIAAIITEENIALTEEAIDTAFSSILDDVALELINEGVNEKFRAERNLLKKNAKKLPVSIIEDFLMKEMPLIIQEVIEEEARNKVAKEFVKMTLKIGLERAGVRLLPVKEIEPEDIASVINDSVEDDHIPGFADTKDLKKRKKKKDPKKKKVTGNADIVTPLEKKSLDELILEGKVALSDGLYSQAIANLEEALVLLSASQDNNLKKANTYYLVGQAYKAQMSFIKAKLAYESSLNLFKKIQTHKAIIDKIAFQLFNINVLEHNDKEAKKYLADISNFFSIEGAKIFHSLALMHIRDTAKLEDKMDLFFLSIFRSFQIIVHFPEASDERKEIENTLLEYLHIISIGKNYNPGKLLDLIKKNINNYKLLFKKDYTELFKEEAFLKYITEKAGYLETELMSQVVIKPISDAIPEKIFLNPIADYIDSLPKLKEMHIIRALIADEKSSLLLPQLNSEMISFIYDHNQQFPEFTWMNIASFGANKAISGSYQLKYIATAILHLDYFLPETTEHIVQMTQKVNIQTSFLSYAITLAFAMRPIIDTNYIAYYTLGSSMVFLSKKITHIYIQQLKIDFMASNPKKADEYCKYISALQIAEDVINLQIYSMLLPKKTFEPYPGYGLLTNAAIVNIECVNYDKKPEKPYSQSIFIKAIPYIIDFLVIKSLVNNLINYNSKLHADIHHIRFSEGIMKMVYISEIYIAANSLVTVDYLSKLAIDSVMSFVVQPVGDYLGEMYNNYLAGYNPDQSSDN